MGQIPGRFRCAVHSTTNMTVSLLSTKIHRPPIRSSFVRRPRLVERLEAGRVARLTLVAAPAGYGKSSLVAEWLGGTAGPVAWLTLDPGDVDPVRFMEYVAGALCDVDPELHRTIARMIEAGQPPSPSAFVEIVIDHASTWASQVVLAFDDYHVIDSLDIHRIVGGLVDQGPAALHLVIISRSDPPLPLSRLRAHAELTEIRADDLRFRVEETRAFFGRAERIRVSDATADALEAHTEGWVAGLQLAAIALRGEPDPDRRAADFSGEHRRVVDYLTEDVIGRQPAAVRRFLLETSVLDRLCAGLCDAVTGDGHGQTMLERLEQEHLFIVPLDDSRTWYRYHHMFAEALRLRLRREAPDRVSGLLERAARWSAEKDSPETAVEYALDAGAHDVAIPLIDRLAQTTLFAQARWTTLLRWTERLPEDLLDGSPGLALARAWALFATGSWQQAARLLERLERSIDAGRTDADALVLAGLETLRASIHYERGDLEACLADSIAALRRLPPEDGFMRSVAELNAGLAQHWLGDVARARETFDRALGLALDSGNTTIALLAIGGAMEVALEQERGLDIDALYERALEIGSGPGGILHPPAGMALVVMGERMREGGALEDAEGVLREGIALCESQGGMPEIALQGRITLARVVLAAGREAEARSITADLNARLSAHRSRPGHPDAVLRRVLRDRLRLRIELGDVTGVAEAEAPHADGLVEPLSERELEILILVAAGRSNPEIAEALHLSRHTIKVYLSRIFDKLGVRGRAQAVSRAYDLGLLAR